MKFMLVLAQLGATVVHAEAFSKMHFVNCAALAAFFVRYFNSKFVFVLLLRLELFLNFEKKMSSYKIVLIKK